MIGIKDTLELNAARDGNHDRLADRIIGTTKGQGRRNWHTSQVQPPANPLRRYTRSTFSGLVTGAATPQHAPQRRLIRAS